MAFLLLYALVSGIVFPPFYKDQNIHITSIESHTRQSGYRTRTYKNIQYNYTTKNDQVRYGKLNTYKLPFVNVGDKIKFYVYTPLSEGGEFSIRGFTLFFLFSAYFLSVFVLKQLTSIFFKKELHEATIIIIAIVSLFAFSLIERWE